MIFLIRTATALAMCAALLVIEGVHLASTTQIVILGVALAGLTAAFLQREMTHPDPVFQPRFFASY